MTSPDKKQKRACLGKIAAPHGVKGLVKIFPYGDDPTLIQTLSPVFTSEDKDEKTAITLKNAMGKYILAEIENCNSREDAESLKGTELWVNKDDLPDLEDGDEFYIDDLNGLDAFNADTNEQIGKIISVQNYGAGDLLEFKPLIGDSYFIPFQNEHVGDVDLDDNKITLHNPEQFKID